jgi:hypothetical protein
MDGLFIKLDNAGVKAGATGSPSISIIGRPKMVVQGAKSVIDNVPPIGEGASAVSIVMALGSPIVRGGKPVVNTLGVSGIWVAAGEIEEPGTGAGTSKGGKRFVISSTTDSVGVPSASVGNGIYFFLVFINYDHAHEVP